MSETAAPAAAPASAPSTSTPAAKTAPAAPKGGRQTIEQFQNQHVFSSGADSDFEDLDADLPDVPDEGDPEPAEDNPTPLEAAEPEETEVVEEDFSWLDPVKQYKEGIHGLQVAEILEAINKGQLPDALLKQIKIKLKDGDEEWEDTLEKARNGAMMRRNYQKKTQELAQLREAFEGERGDFAQMLNNWKTDPKALKAGMARLGLPFLEAAKLLAEEHKMLAQMTPRERELYEENQKYQAQLEQQKFEQSKQSREKASETAKQREERNVNFASQAGQKFLQEAGVPVNKGTWQSFLRYLNYEIQANPGVQEWSEEMIRNSVESTLEEYSQLKSQVAAGEAPAPKPQLGTKPAPQGQSPARQQVAKAGLTGGKVDSGNAPKPRPRGKMTIADWNKKHGI